MNHWMMMLVYGIISGVNLSIIGVYNLKGIVAPEPFIPINWIIFIIIAAICIILDFVFLIVQSKLNNELKF